jgi:Heparinase II/III-like protein/Heparinase II/III N-terminus
MRLFERVAKLVSEPARTRYLYGRLRETPPRFLLTKARLELRRRLHRGRVLRAARSGRRFSDGYQHGLPAARSLARAIRGDVLRALRSLELSDSQLTELLAADFDAGRTPCLGYGYLALRKGRWAADEFHDHSWPPDYFADVDFVRPGTRCDVKVPWEKSRLQWLTRAALAACVDADPSRRERRLGAALELLHDWVAENPYGLGVNWVSAMEVAIRAVNLLLTFCFLEGQADEEDLLAILTSAGEHLHYLRRFPETSDVPGNHWLATQLGLYFLEQFSAGADAGGRQALAFVEASQGQFTPQGLHVEFSPNYHRLSLDMVVVGQGLMRRRWPERAARLDGLVARGVRACQLLANHGGELPVMGDNDSGKVLDFGQPGRGFGALLGPPQAGDRPPGEQVLGAVLSGLGWQSPSLAPAATTITALPPFVIWETKDTKLVVRAGELGLAGRATHDHDDNLSFWYSVGGRDLIVEAGCPPYTRDRAERARAISSFAHNVLSAGDGVRYPGAQGSVMLTPRGGPRGRARIARGGTEPSIEAELLQGDVDAPHPLVHRRSFHRTPAGDLLIRDRAALHPAQGFALRLHFPIGAPVEEVRVEGQEVLVRLLGAWARLRVSGSSDLTAAAVPYRCCLDYGDGEEATCLLLRGRAGRELSVETLVSVRPAEEPPPCR